MHLNTLQNAPGEKANTKRVGRGIGSGLGKTCGRGHKGQHARNTVKQGFEGGQMPFHRRVPKRGFRSWRIRFTEEIRLSELANLEAEVINLQTLRDADLIKQNTLFAKIILSGTIDKPVTVSGVKVTKGAAAAIEAAGGKVQNTDE